MAAGEGSSEPDEDDTLLTENGEPAPKQADAEVESDSEDDEDDEPRPSNMRH